MILSNYQIIKELGYGMFGTVYEIKTLYNKKHYALKIQHIEKKDIKNTNKSSIWREINFSINFANKYHDQFIKLYDYDFISDCELKQKYAFDTSTFPLEFQKKINKLSSSPYCVRTVYEMVQGDLYQLRKKLSLKQFYSLIIQLTYIVELLHKNNYIHGDIHTKNIGWIKTTLTKIKLGKLQIPTFGYIFKLIDYGTIMNKLDIHNKKEQKIFENNYENELFSLIFLVIDDSQIYDYVNKNNISRNFNEKYNEFKKTKFYDLIKKYFDNKYIQLFLFDILFQDQYQKIAFGKYYTKTILRKLYIPIEDIEYLIFNHKTPNKIIKYFNNLIV